MKVEISLIRYCALDPSPPSPRTATAVWTQQVQVPPTLLPKPAMTVGPNVFRCDCHMAYLKAWALTTASGRTPPFLRDNLPHVLGLQTVECRTHFR